MSDIGVGVIGCGYWGPQLIRNLSDTAGATLRMVADLRPERRMAVQRQYPSITTTESVDALLDHPGIDAVVIATPVRTHYPLARQALESGKHVLVEKPLACSVVEAEDLIASAAARDLRLMVGHTFEYNPAVHALKRLIDTGALGNLRYIDAARLNLGLFQHDINVLWDLAPHDISILLYLLGMEPFQVSARGKDFVRPGIEDVVYLELLFKNNICAYVHVSWLEPCKVRRVTIVGDEKMVVYNDVSAEEKIRIHDRAVSHPPRTETFAEFQLSYRYGDIYSPRIAWSEPLRAECAHFIDCIKTGRQPLSDGRSGLRVVRILERATQSLALGGVRIDLKPAHPGYVGATKSPIGNSVAAH